MDKKCILECISVINKKVSEITLFWREYFIATGCTILESCVLHHEVLFDHNC